MSKGEYPKFVENCVATMEVRIFRCALLLGRTFLFSAQRKYLTMNKQSEPPKTFNGKNPSCLSYIVGTFITIVILIFLFKSCDSSSSSPKKECALCDATGSYYLEGEYFCYEHYKAMKTILDVYGN